MGFVALALQGGRSGPPRAGQTSTAGTRWICPRAEDACWAGRREASKLRLALPRVHPAGVRNHVGAALDQKKKLMSWILARYRVRQGAIWRFFARGMVSSRCWDAGEAKASGTPWRSRPHSLTAAQAEKAGRAKKG